MNIIFTFVVDCAQSPASVISACAEDDAPQNPACSDALPKTLKSNSEIVFKRMLLQT